MWSNPSHSTLTQAIAEAIHAYSSEGSKTPQGLAQSISLTHTQLAAIIDHTLLAPNATREQFEALCQEAKTHGFYSVCVPGAALPWVKPILENHSQTLPIAVIGFPHGTGPSKAKAFEASECVRLGAQEIDMVISVSNLKSKDYGAVFDDIAQVVDASIGRPVKVILETALLTDAEKIAACVISKKAGARFVKTCTGFSGGQATEADIALMRFTVGPDFGVKASGGIRSFETAVAMVRAGANRLGTSSSVTIVKPGNSESKQGDY